MLTLDRPIARSCSGSARTWRTSTRTTWHCKPGLRAWATRLAEKSDMSKASDRSMSSGRLAGSTTGKAGAFPYMSAAWAASGRSGDAGTGNRDLGTGSRITRKSDLTVYNTSAWCFSYAPSMECRWSSFTDWILSMIVRDGILICWICDLASQPPQSATSGCTMLILFEFLVS